MCLLRFLVGKWLGIVLVAFLVHTPWDWRFFPTLVLFLVVLYLPVHLLARHWERQQLPPST